MLMLCESDERSWRFDRGDVDPTPARLMSPLSMKRAYIAA